MKKPSTSLDLCFFVVSHPCTDEGGHPHQQKLWNKVFKHAHTLIHTPCNVNTYSSFRGRLLSPTSTSSSSITTRSLPFLRAFCPLNIPVLINSRFQIRFQFFFLKKYSMADFFFKLLKKVFFQSCHFCFVHYFQLYWISCLQCCEQLAFNYLLFHVSCLKCKEKIVAIIFLSRKLHCVSIDSYRLSLLHFLVDSGRRLRPRWRDVAPMATRWWHHRKADRRSHL